ncbi:MULTISPECIES: AAA family ATPase [Hyphomicrobiales]|uniref:Adenylate kinase n=1 Tax=Stappia indica TaxID=538381 RepID=A0A857C859_9HYPH|nr:MULTISPECIES: AAA family ATPase [Hyphomicrobiales]EXL02182.1 adenylate kinase [Brucella anthropi]MBR7654778.1 adenylate kinase [Brucella oryzae]QGZ35216.1 adenylate kinase [Stappia indica]WGG60806.1 adenylate kinase [Brucella intermedia]WKT93031.1 adenylate kinase [Brucella anthropi]
MSDKPCVYLTGASCSGVSTLGSILSKRFRVPQIDVDDYYWMPTDPPYSTKRAPEERVQLIKDRQSSIVGWILTGSFIGWGDSLIRDVDLIVFLYTPTPVRLQRLDEREAERHGSRILPGGDMHDAHLAFRDWASRYDDPEFTGRNFTQHQKWLSKQSAPVLRLDGEHDSELLADQVARQLDLARYPTGG